jgi:NADH-quinone oxidoreductase subunit N
MTQIISAAMYPEIAVSVGALVLMLVGLLGRDDEGNGALLSWLAILVLIGAGALVLSQGNAAPQALYDNAFIADAFGRFMKLLVIAGGIGALLLSLDSMRDVHALKFEYPLLVLFATAGMMMMISAGDLIALYLGLELQSLSLYVLAGFRREDVKGSEAAMKYLVLGALSSGMLLYGASLIYGATGSTSFATIAEAAKAGHGLMLTVGLVLVLVGIAFKIAAVPFHMWTPDVYEGSPTPVTAFFAAAPKLAAMALLIRVLYGAFPALAGEWRQIITFISLASMILGAFAAIGQTNIKRLMAYSSIGHVGFALVGLAAGSKEGIEGVLVYLAIYLVMTLGVFAIIVSMRRDKGATEEIADLAGLSQTNLPMAFALAMLLFSLAGVPPLAGFFAKWYVFAAAVKAGLYPLAIIGVLSSVVGCFYYLRIVKVMFFDNPVEAFAPVRAKAGLVMALATLFILGYVLMPAPLVAAASHAAGSFGF